MATPGLPARCRSRKLTASDTYEFVLNAPVRDLLGQVVREAAQAPFRFEAIQVPEQVLVSACRVPGGYAIHLLNATGVQLAAGDTIPGAAPADPFPPLPEDLVFDLRVEELSGGRVVSPDYEGTRVPGVERNGDVCRISVPRDALSAYAIVHLYC